MFITLMRKLMAVFIIAVFSVVLYGCGGSGGSHRSDSAMMDMPKSVADMLAMLTDGHLDTQVMETTNH